jgi:tetratricopeptide (TPR) repeat protein
MPSFSARGTLAAFVVVGLVSVGLPSLAYDPSGLPEETVARIEAGRRPAVEADLEDTLNSDPSDQFARFRLALVSARGSELLFREAGRRAGGELPEYRLIALAEYALAAGDATRALAYASQYAEAYPDGSLRDMGQFRMAQCELATGRADLSEERFDWLSRNAAEPWRGYGLYGQAQSALARGDTAEAIRVLKQAGRLSGHEISAPALLLLGQLHEARGESAEAFRYLSLYREAYPNGMLPLVTATPRTGHAEAAAGLTFAIQVGVFGDKANADLQSARFRELKYPVVQKSRTLGGRHYTAVLVGRFQDREKAQKVRLELEQRFDESYRVVVME